MCQVAFREYVEYTMNRIIKRHIKVDVEKIAITSKSHEENAPTPTAGIHT